MALNMINCDYLPTSEGRHTTGSQLTRLSVYVPTSKDNLDLDAHK